MPPNSGDTGYLKATPRRGGGLLLQLTDQLCLDNVEAVLLEFEAELERKPALIELNLSALDYLDSAGAMGLVLMQKKAAQMGASLSLNGMSEASQGIVKLIDPKSLEAEPLISLHRKGNIIERIGEAALDLWADVQGTVSFLGGFFQALARAALNPARIRWGEVGLYMEKVGADGLGIIGLIGFLMGLIIAFMSSLQLRNFGADIYVGPLLALAMVSELGPIMTAILVAGRSGSAFAAEIGTMKVNEEVDALAVMGFDPISFLAVPKVLAAVLVVPLLTLYADLAGILGGLFVGVFSLNLTPYTYLKSTMDALTTTEVIKSLIKSVTFAVLIAGIGCQRGFVVRGGAQAVGAATTSAVVAAMFLIIVADSLFAIIYHYLGV